MQKKEKIKCLGDYLEKEENYADSFKGEIACIMGDFEEDNPLLSFLDRLTNEKAIHQYIDRLTSRIVMKYDPEWESLGDFVWDYVENG
jgi:hypothetical protein